MKKTTCDPFIWRQKKPSGVEMNLFRREAAVSCLPEQWLIRITADSRYRLFVNGQPVLDGPCRPSPGIRYIDEVDIRPFLHKGQNTVLVWAAHYSTDEEVNARFAGGPVSLLCGAQGFLRIEDDREVWGTRQPWTCCSAERGYAFAHIISQLSFMERMDTRCFPAAMYFPGYDAAGWQDAVSLGETLLDGFQLQNRPIPYFPWQEHAFSGIVRRSDSIIAWDRLLTLQPLDIPAGTDTWVELKLDTYDTGFPQLILEGGAGAKLTLTYAECYKQCRTDGTLYKGIRDDAGDRAVLDGFADGYIADGETQVILPFMYRAFRFVRVHIRTKEEPLTLRRFTFLRTGYPLPVETAFSSSREDYTAIWQISLQTLKCCMYETYMDCPYYEQLQYGMDTFLQIAYTLAVSRDHRLIRRALNDFCFAQQKDGQIPSRAPAKVLQLIPGFSLFFVFMAELYSRCVGNYTELDTHLQAVRRILEFFESRQNADGLVVTPESWNFVDWVPGWDRGSPLTASTNGNTIYTLMLTAAYRSAGYLFALSGDAEASEDMIKRAEALAVRVTAAARDPHGFFRDECADGGTCSGRLSQHAQIWAVLAEAVTGEDAARLMRQTWENPQLAPVSYCMVWFLLRAMEKAGLYGQTESIWQKYRSLLPMHLTTWPEDDLEARSDCHGWSAVALYEFTVHGLGVCVFPERGYVRICPQMLWLGSCAGEVPTPWGNLRIEWEYENGRFTLSAASAQPIPMCIRLPNGESFSLTGKEAAFTAMVTE